MGLWGSHIFRKYSRRAALGGAMFGVLVAAAVLASNRSQVLSSPFPLVAYLGAIPLIFAFIGYASVYLFVARYGYRIQDHRASGGSGRRRR